MKSAQDTFRDVLAQHLDVASRPCADADCAGKDFCPWQFPEIHADGAGAPSGVH